MPRPLCPNQAGRQPGCIFSGSPRPVDILPSALRSRTRKVDSFSGLNAVLETAAETKATRARRSGLQVGGNLLHSLHETRDLLP